MGELPASGGVVVHTVFLDRCLGTSDVANALQDAGVFVELLDDTPLPQDVSDVVWLRYATERGCLALSKDKNIRHRRNELSAVKRSGARLYVLTSGNLGGDEMGDAFRRAMPRIIKLANEREGPYIAKVFKDGRIALVWPAPKPE